MKNRAKIIEDLHKLADTIIQDLLTGKAIDAEVFKRKCEVIRVENTNIRTEMAMTKLAMSMQKLTVKTKRVA